MTNTVNLCDSCRSYKTKDCLIDKIDSDEIDVTTLNDVLFIKAGGVCTCQLYKPIKLRAEHQNRLPHWIISSDGYYPYCSVCGAEPRSGDMTAYCPNCGSRMDE